MNSGVTVDRLDQVLIIFLSPDDIMASTFFMSFGST
jgi:hypothetical protein